MDSFVLFGFYIVAALFFFFAVMESDRGEGGQRNIAIAIVCAMVSGMFFGWAIWLTVKELGL